MKLNIAERLTLLNVVPKEGNYATLKVVRKLQEDLSFSEEDFKKYKLVQKGEQITWDTDADNAEQKDVDIGEMALDMIQTSLKELDTKKKLKAEHFLLFEKFVENPPKD